MLLGGDSPIQFLESPATEHCHDRLPKYGSESKIAKEKHGSIITSLHSCNNNYLTSYDKNPAVCKKTLLYFWSDEWIFLSKTRARNCKDFITLAVNSIVILTMISEKLEWENIVEQVCSGHEQRVIHISAAICPIHSTRNKGWELITSFPIEFDKLTWPTTWLFYIVWPVYLMSHLYKNELRNVVATKATVPDNLESQNLSNVTYI